MWCCRQIVWQHQIYLWPQLSLKTGLSETNRYTFCVCLHYVMGNSLLHQPMEKTATYLDRRFGCCPIGTPLLTRQKSNLKSPYMRPLLHVAQKPWRWNIQDWTISYQSVLLLTPGVGAVIQQLIEKQSLSQQLLWQFSNKQAENTHPCTPTSHTKTTVKWIFILFAWNICIHECTQNWHNSCIIFWQGYRTSLLCNLHKYIICLSSPGLFDSCWAPLSLTETF